MAKLLDRPDLLFRSCDLSRSVKSATVEDILRASKVLRKAKEEHVAIKFPGLGDITKSTIVVYSDVSHTNLADGGSQGGHIIFVVNEDGSVEPKMLSKVGQQN